MAYVYDRFGTASLVLYDVKHPLDTGSMDLDLVPLTNGEAFNPHGSGVGHRTPLRLTLAGSLLGSSWANLETQFDSLAALRFSEARLYRRSIGTSRVQFATAVLTHVDGDLNDTGGLEIPVVCDFALESATWSGIEHGPAWVLNSGVFLDTGRALNEATGDLFNLVPASPDTIVIANGGNVAQTNVSVTVTVPAATTALTSIRFQGGGTDITVAVTVAAGTALIIDSGGWSVTNAGSNAYSSLTINAGHTIDTLFRLEPGNTTYTITYVDGSASTTLLWTYNEAFA